MRLGIVKAGFLEKKARHRRGWDQRYFVLTRHALHRYIKHPADDLFGSLRETLPLTCITSVFASDADGQKVSTSRSHAGSADDVELVLQHKLESGAISQAEYNHMKPLAAIEDDARAIEADAAADAREPQMFYFDIQLSSGKRTRFRALYRAERAAWIELLARSGAGAAARASAYGAAPRSSLCATLETPVLHLILADAPSVADGAAGSTAAGAAAGAAAGDATLRGCTVVRASLESRGLEWETVTTARLPAAGARIRAVCYGGATASFGRSELRAFPHLDDHPLLVRHGRGPKAAAVSAAAVGATVPTAEQLQQCVRLPLQQCGAATQSSLLLRVHAIKRAPAAAAMSAAGAAAAARAPLVPAPATSTLSAPRLADAPPQVHVSLLWWGVIALFPLALAAAMERQWGWTRLLALGAAFALLLGGIALQQRRSGERSAAGAAAPSAKERRRAQRAARVAQRAAQRTARQQRVHASDDGGALPDLLVTFALTPHRGGAASGARGLLAERPSLLPGDDEIFVVASPVDDGGERAAPHIDARAAAIDALLRDACEVPSGWTSEPRLTETMPLGAIDHNAVSVARRALHELWDIHEEGGEEEAEGSNEESASSAGRGGSSARLETRGGGGDATARAPLGWCELDGTLLTQYVRGYRHDDVDEWCEELTDKLQRGLLLRGRGEVALDGVELDLFAAAAAATAAATTDGPWGANTSALPWSRRELLRRRVPGDNEVYAAFPSFVYGESERGHVLHGERTSDVDFSSLLRLPLDQVALVRLQLCETLGEIKRRASARLQKRIFKHIVLLDLYNMPLTKLTISAAARKIVGQILEVQSMYPEGAYQVWLVNTPSLFFRSYKMLIEPRMNDQTLKKMHVLGADNDEAVRQMVAEGIPLEAIPTWLGGGHAGLSLLDVAKEFIAESEGGSGAVGNGRGE